MSMVEIHGMYGPTYIDINEISYMITFSDDGLKYYIYMKHTEKRIPITRKQAKELFDLIKEEEAKGQPVEKEQEAYRFKDIEME